MDPLLYNIPGWDSNEDPLNDWEDLDDLPEHEDMDDHDEY